VSLSLSLEYRLVTDIQRIRVRVATFALSQSVSTAGDAGGAGYGAGPGDPSSAAPTPASASGATTTSTSAVRGRFQPPVLSAHFRLFHLSWVRFTTRRLSVPVIPTARQAAKMW